MSGKPQALRFERVRTFGKIMGDTRKFVRENFVVFFKTILFHVGPIALLTCTLHVFYQVNIMERNQVNVFNRFGSYLAATVIYTQIRWALNGFITAIVVSHFVKVYREKGAGKFDVSDVTKSMLRDFGGSLLAFFIMFVSVALVSTILGVMIFGLADVSPGTAIFLVFAGWLGYILLRFPFWYFVYSVFIARTTEKKNLNVFEGMSLSAKVFSGNWWSTWVIFFLMWLILYLIGTAVAMPAQIAAMVMRMVYYDFDDQSDNWKLIQTILLSLGEVMKTLIDAVCMITIALQFYNLKEKNDGQGTAEIVNTIGTKEDDETAEYTY